MRYLPSDGTTGLVSLAALIMTFGVGTLAEQADNRSIVSVSAGQDHTCALATDGTTYCWGANDVGQLGTGAADTGPHFVPHRVDGGISFRAIASGHRHSCGLAADGQAFCWGLGLYGQLGQGALTNSATPVPVGGGHRFTSITAGGTHTCALTSVGVAYCWGGNWHGQLGSGSLDGDSDTPCCHKAPTPVAGDLTFRTVDAGGIHTCSVTSEGHPYCWGAGQVGRLGLGTNDGPDRAAPVRVMTSANFDVVSAGGWNTCGIATRSNDAYCWGSGQQGQLGIGTSPSAADSPLRVKAAVQFRAISVSTYYVCALGVDDRVYCWGSNRHGQLGDGSREDRILPTPTADENKYRLVSAGGNEFSGHACGLAVQGAVFCWGDNRRGQLGDGSTSSRSAPVRVTIDRTP
jgi:alpha-tubulin suppressor-like RCC1 family protein